MENDTAYLGKQSQNQVNVNINQDKYMKMNWIKQYDNQEEFNSFFMNFLLTEQFSPSRATFKSYSQFIIRSKRLKKTAITTR